MADGDGRHQCAHTLSDFRVAHVDALHELFVQTLGLLSAEGLITLERVMQDGTRVARERIVEKISP